MAGRSDPQSRIHDLFSVVLGALAAAILISARWEVDTSGPYPFYKGPLIFPLIVLSLMILASLPSAVRLLRRPAEVSWRLDGAGAPVKPLIILCFLVAFLAGIVVIGLEVSSFLFLIISLYLLGHRSPTILVGLPLIVTAIVVVIFKHFLGVFFPTPLLLEWLMGVE